MTNYYSWTGINSNSLDWFFLHTTVSVPSLNIESLFDLTFLIAPIIPTFVSNFFALNTFSSISLLDILITQIYNTSSLTFYSSFYLDFLLNFKNFSFLLEFIFISDKFDILNTFLVQSPELLFTLNDYMNSFLTFNYELTETYNLFSYNSVNLLLDYINNLFYFILWTIFILIFFNNLTSFNITGIFNFFYIRYVTYVSNFSSENRMQFDWVLSFLLFIFICWIPTLMAYDDVNVEVIESFHSFVLNFFILAIFYLIYKYSIHYFSFLENSVSDGYTTSFIAKQFVRDVSNTFALFLRFFLLVFRLNIYDGLDDFLDSYYIFFIDFDEDSYSDEFIASEFLNNFISDNSEDISNDKPYDFDLWSDLYSRYFILVSKFLLFWFFILEEIFRVILAFYISYLIIFEVHAVNTSYSEDSFIAKKIYNLNN